MPWSRAFDDPVPLPDSGELRSLRDARDYIAKLPNFVISTPRWLAAITALMSVVVYGGDTMLPRVGIIRALYPRETEPRPHKKRSIKFRIVRGSSKEVRGTKSDAAPVLLPEPGFVINDGCRGDLFKTEPRLAPSHQHRSYPGVNAAARKLPKVALNATKKRWEDA